MCDVEGNGSEFTVTPNSVTFFDDRSSVQNNHSNQPLILGVVIMGSSALNMHTSLLPTMLKFAAILLSNEFLRLFRDIAWVLRNSSEHFT